MKSFVKRAANAVVMRARRMTANLLGEATASLGKFRLYDCFIFNDELDMLEIRLEELYEHVDVFVLVESTETFAGKPKPLHYGENRARFSRFESKIRHVVVDRVPETARETSGMDSTKKSSEPYQRRMMKEGLHDARPGDMILVSDVDEIPVGSKVRANAWKSILTGEPIIYKQEWHVLYLNARVKGSVHGRADAADEAFNWYGTMGCTMQQLRTQFGLDTNALWGTKWGFCVVFKLPNAGWHLSWMGGAQKVCSKIRDVAARNYGLEDIELLKAQTFNGQIFEFVPDHQLRLPGGIQRNRAKYEHLFGSEDNLRQTIEQVSLEWLPAANAR